MKNKPSVLPGFKKYLLLALVSAICLLLLTLSACSSSHAEPDAESTAPVSVSEIAPSETEPAGPESEKAEPESSSAQQQEETTQEETEEATDIVAADSEELAPGDPEKAVSDEPASVFNDEAPQVEKEGREYVANKNTMKFHDPNCRSVPQIKEKNRWDVVCTREDLIEWGYVPCKNCNP